MRVYVAGKINGMHCASVQNVHKMMTLGERLRQLGFSVFVPGLNILMGVMFGNYEYDDYFNSSQEWLEVSDALYVCPGWEESNGTKKEINRAYDLGIPVCFTIEELEKVREEYEAAQGRLDEALSGLHNEPGESRYVSCLELDQCDECNSGTEHLAE